MINKVAETEFGWMQNPYAKTQAAIELISRKNSSSNPEDKAYIHDLFTEATNDFYHKSQPAGINDVRTEVNDKIAEGQQVKQRAGAAANEAEAKVLNIHPDRKVTQGTIPVDIDGFDTNFNERGRQLNNAHKQIPNKTGVAFHTNKIPTGEMPINRPDSNVPQNTKGNSTILPDNQGKTQHFTGKTK
jgi:uncharacterized protein (DUF1501 family)